VLHGALVGLKEVPELLVLLCFAGRVLLGAILKAKAMLNLWLRFGVSRRQRLQSDLSIPVLCIRNANTIMPTKLIP
jgi:hypothetical protein